ncbi:hypothetical protein AB0903_31735 [Streptomyces sp. NPDC048389]|uniref:hypothetical protein n=1 Tax=Streptomyces sp. NPDC048389 TaxID=3154622 RepID=UPI003451EE99
MNDTSRDRTEQQLREALGALACNVHATPDAYRLARGDWLRRERRRRLVLTALITVVFALAILIGLWVLNQNPSGPGVVFHHTHGQLGPGRDGTAAFDLIGPL